MYSIGLADSPKARHPPELGADDSELTTKRDVGQESRKSRKEHSHLAASGQKPQALAQSRPAQLTTVLRKQSKSHPGPVGSGSQGSRH